MVIFAGGAGFKMMLDWVRYRRRDSIHVTTISDDLTQRWRNDALAMSLQLIEKDRILSEEMAKRDEVKRLLEDCESHRSKCICQ